MIRFSAEIFNGFKVGIEHIDGSVMGDTELAWMIVLDIACFRFAFMKFTPETS